MEEISEAVEQVEASMVEFWGMVALWITIWLLLQFRN